MKIIEGQDKNKTRYVDETNNKINRNPDWPCDYCGQFSKETKQENSDQHQVPEKQEHISFLNLIKKLFVPISATMLIIFSVILGISLFTPKEVELSISEVKWNCTINIEKFQTIQQNGWILPVDARLLYTKEELYKPVEDVYKNCRIAKSRVYFYPAFIIKY